MRQRVIIKESELKNLVEGVLNELDFRTYLNAMKKADQRFQESPYDEVNDDRRFKFLNAASKAFADKAGISPNDTHFNLTSAQPRMKNKWYSFVNDSNGNLWHLPTNWSDACPNDPHKLKFQDKNIRDLSSYMAGQSHYNHDKGKWENESLIRSITEEVIRRLKGW